MSLIDNKRKVLTTIGAYTSFMEQSKLPKRTDVFTSISNKKDIIPYLLDTLKTIAGTESLKELIGGMFTKLVDNAESKVKVALKNQFIQNNSDDTLGSHFNTTNGITVKIKDIDIKGKFKITPTSDSGDLIYNKIVPNFDKIAYDSILTGSEQKFDLGGINVKYIESSDSFNIRPISNMKVGEFFTNYIDNVQIIDKNELITNVMDSIYGVFSKKTNKTSDEVLANLKIQKLLEQVANGDDSFIIPTEENDKLLIKAKELSEGVVNYDMCCGLMPVTLPFEDLTTLLKTISGSTDSFLVGNSIENTINQSTVNNTAPASENKQTIRDGFFQKLINLFVTELSYFVTTSPQIRLLLSILSSIHNNGSILINSAIDDLKKFATMIYCMVREIIKMIGEFIFNLAVSYLIKLIEPIIKKIIKEKVNQYTNIIKSLTPLGKVLSG